MANRALLVGINDYQGISDLRGCINDVTNMRDILKTHLGFTNKDIRVLVDRRATRANILKRLRWMVDGAKPGDFLVFHFSGHGSQIRDRDGDELQDQMDELICPWDMNWDSRPTQKSLLLPMICSMKSSASSRKIYYWKFSWIAAIPVPV